MLAFNEKDLLSALSLKFEEMHATTLKASEDIVKMQKDLDKLRNEVRTLVQRLCDVLRSCRVESGQVRSGQVRSGQVRSTYYQVRSWLVKSSQVNFIRSYQVRSGQTRSGQVRSGQVSQFFAYNSL